MTSPYAKAIVAILGSALTAALGILPPDTTLWTLLTILSAAVTTAGVYVVPNTPSAPKTLIDGLG